MAGNRPPSLGDSNVELQLVRYTEPLASSRREIVSQFEAILNRNLVQKVTVQVGKPIEVTQYVDRSSSLPPVEAPASDLWGQVRNGELIEPLVDESVKGLWIFYYAFRTLEDRRCKAKMIFCHRLKVLRDWLHLPETDQLKTMFGVEVASHPDVPDDAIVIAATNYDESEVFGLRMPIDLEPRKS